MATLQEAKAAFARLQAASRYINRLRKPEKRAYAEAYLRWLTDGTRPRPPEPERPAGLSYMAAQAVRLALDSYRTRARPEGA